MYLEGSESDSSEELITSWSSSSYGSMILICPFTVHILECGSINSNITTLTGVDSQVLFPQSAWWFLRQHHRGQWMCFGSGDKQSIFTLTHREARFVSFSHE